MIEVKNKKECTEINEGEKIMMISTPTCGVCRMMGGTMDRLEDQTGVSTYKIDGVQNPDIVEEFDVRSVPLFVFYKDNEPVKTELGFKTLQDLVEITKGLQVII